MALTINHQTNDISATSGSVTIDGSPVGGGGGGITYTVKTANYTASAGEGILADTSGGAFTITLPSSPSAGDQIIIADSGGDWVTNNLTIDPDGNTIEGLSDTVVFDISDLSVELIYDGSTWQIYSTGTYISGGGSGGSEGVTTGKAIAMAIVFG